MNLFTRFLLVISLPLFLSTVILAQEESGQIQGVVSDSTTGDNLFGANVFLEGTSLGAATDASGKYKITRVPAGSYNFIVRYIGYKSKEIAINVVGGKTLELNVAIPSEVIEGTPVVVSAQATGQRGAINQQLTSNTLINVVSAEKIHELPDANAATALSRLPGVSLMNGDQVVIRGVEAKLNEVLINGVQLPSTDMNDRSTNLGFISSNMLSGIEVVKALTPDMDANAIGGVVNLRLRTAPENFHFDVLASGNYNGQDRTTDNYSFWFSASDRFFNNKLGVFLQGNADRSNVGNQSARAGYGLLAKGNTDYGQATYQMNNATLEDDVDLTLNNGGSLILDYKLPNGSIILQNTLAHTFTDQRNYTNLLTLNGTPNVNYGINRERYGKDLYINSLQAENSFGDLNVNLGLSHSFSDRYSQIRYGDFANWLFNNQTTAVHPFGLDAGGNPKAYTNQTLTLTMNDVYRIFDNLDPADADSATLGGWLTASTQAFHQHLYNAFLDLSMPVTFSKDVTAKFKAGGKFLRTTRTNDPNTYYTGTGDVDTYAAVKHFFPGITNDENHHVKFTSVWDRDFQSKRGKYFLQDEYNFKNGFQYSFNVPLMDAWMTQSETGWEPAAMYSETWHNDFHGAEIFAAGYLMGTFDLFSKLTLIAGLRYELYNMNYTANFTYVTHGVYGDAITSANGSIKKLAGDSTLLPSSYYTVDRNDNNVFPDALLKYKINDWSDVRFAYTNGIARPDYLAILPKTYFTQDYNTLEIGNTKLKPTTVRNFDLGISFYSNEIGLFTITGFTKRLENVSFSRTYFYKNAALYGVTVPDSAFWADYKLTPPLATTPTSSYINNNHPGYVKGIEIDWQTNFWYLPKPFNSLVLDINYTKATSEMDYHQVLTKDSTYRLNGHTITVLYNVDTIFTARLVHQANDVLNAALGIDYKGFSGRISFNLQGNIINSVNISPENDQYTGNIYRWDFTLKQELPLDGLSITVSGVNIFHNPIYTYQKFRRDVDKPITENLQSVLYTPTIFSANLRYSF